MRIATWNINGLRARLDFVKHWLAARQPDIVGFQELKLSDDNFPHEEFEAAGYRSVTHGQKSWNGVAILSKDAATVTQEGLPGQEEMGARLITADVGGISFTTVYVPNGKTLSHDDYPRKLAWLDSLANHLRERELANRPAILCGDFNVCPEAIDSWNETGYAGRIFHTDAERERIRALFDVGFHDVFREMHPDTQKFSWWDYRGGAFHRKMGLRIDFLLATAELRPRIKSVEIDRDYRKKKEGLTASDHAPVFLDVDT